MDVDRIEYDDIETKLKEHFKELFEHFGAVSSIVKIINKILSQSKLNPETRQRMKEVLKIFSTIDSEKQKCDFLISVALQTIEALEFQGSDSTLKNSNVRPETIVSANLSIETREETSDEFKNYNLYIESASSDRENDSYSSFSNYSSLGSAKSLQSTTENHIDSLDTIKSSVYSNNLKVQEKLLMGSSPILSSKLENLKTGNLSEVCKLKRLKDVGVSIQEMKDDTLQFLRGLKTENPIRMNFRLTHDANHNESEAYSAFNAIFRNNTRDCIPGGNFRPIENVLHKQSNTEMNYDTYLYDQGDIVVMPNDIEGNQEQLDELIQFLKMSNKNSFDVQVQQNLGLNPRRDNESYELDIDITINQPSRKPLKRRFSFRMHVVNSAMFENAMRDCQIYSLELTYTNIFPRDCRMFIALPIYKDGYLDEKDRLDRN